MTRGDFEIESAATREGLPVATSAGPILADARIPLERSLIDKRVVLLCLWAVLLALITGFIAQGLVRLIGREELRTKN